MEIINATGRRKTSVARVYVTPGKGDIRVNARDLKEYIEIQSRYAQKQMQDYARQAQDLGRLLADAAQKVK